MPVRDEITYIDRTSEQLLPLLMAENDGIDFQVGAFNLRVSDVPLFKQSAEEGLHQGVRIAVSGSATHGHLVMTLRMGETVVDQTTCVFTGTRTSSLLFVPEVSDPTHCHVDVILDSGLSASLAFTVRPQRKWSVHLIHHSHYDIGYTDPQATVIESQLGFIDSALDLIAATDDWPDDAQFRWVVEVTDPLRRWLEIRPRAMPAELFRRVREGRIELNALPFSMHTEAYSMDELARQLWFADDLRTEHGIEIVTAMQTDVPGATTGLVTLLTAAGIRYLSVAHNYAGRSVPHLTGGQDLTRPFYWRAPNGERLLVWTTDSTLGYAYMEGNLAGLATGYQATLASLPELLAGLTQRPYPYGGTVFGWTGTGEDFPITKTPYAFDVLHLRVQGFFADNAAPSPIPANVVREWNETWAFPRLRMSTNHAFFTEVEERYGPELATHAGDWTDWWADGIGSAAAQLGLNRQAQSDVRTAQTLHTLADAVLKLNDEPQPARAAAINAVYDNLSLFDEHTWGAANPWRESLSRGNSGALQWARKAAFAHNASEQASALLAGATHRVAALAATATTGVGIAVVNPSSWRRTDLIRMFLPESRLATTGSFSLIHEERGHVTPFVLEPQENAFYRPRGVWITFLARDVPAIGYARYRIVPGPDGADAQVASATTADVSRLSLENEALTLSLDTRQAHIASLVHGDSGRDLIDHDAPFGFNEYIYDQYASAPGFNHLSGRVSASDLALLGSRSTGKDGIIVDRSSNGVWDRLTLRSSGEGCAWIETTLTLPHGLPRLDIANRIHKIATPAKESVYFAFPFAASEPRLTFEITGDLLGPDSPTIPGSARHFRAIRNWVGIEATDAPQIAWATAEAPLIQTGTIHLPYAPFPSTLSPDRSHPATIYSWALNNLWDTNFPPQQGGEMMFRYSVQTGGEGAIAQLGRTAAAAVSSPLVGVVSTPLAKPRGAPLGPTGGFCNVDHPNLSVTHLATSRRGHDLVAFVESTSAEAITARIDFGLLSVVRAAIGTFLERGLVDVPVIDRGVVVTVPAGSIVALSLDLE